MNRTVLEGITVLGHNNNDHYANNALQQILGNMIPDYKAGFFEKPDQNDIGKYIKNTNKYFDDLKEYEKKCKAMNLLIDMFDAIVANGKNHALDFIFDNKRWIS